MYPRNAASPPPIAIGMVVQISDGAVQTTGASARVKTGTGVWGAAANTPTCDTTSGVWEYTPSQAETDATGFMVAIYKASCIGAVQTIITTASSVPGNVQLAASQPATTLAALTVTGALTVSDGVIISATTAGRNGISAAGNTTGHGLTVTGGANGHGFKATGGSAAGDGINATAATSGYGMYIQAATAGGGTAGLYAVGANAGAGILAQGGATNSSGISATGQGTGSGISAVSGAGATGSGISAQSIATNGHGMALISTGTGSGLTSDEITVSGTTTLTGAVTASNGSNNITGVTASVTGDLSATMKSSVNTEVLDVLNTDTFAEPGQENPPATTTLIKKIGYLYKAWRNKSTQTSTEYKLYADDTTTVDQKATASDDGTTFTRGEAATGP